MFVVNCMKTCIKYTVPVQNLQYLLWLKFTCDRVRDSLNESSNISSSVQLFRISLLVMRLQKNCFLVNSILKR